MRYIKQLDAMRAIAILFVFCNHTNTKASLLYEASGIISAPDIFFTISGFLITAILFKDRILNQQNKLSIASSIKIFFIKRIFRILPAYYLTILSVYIINKNEVYNFIPFLNFTANFEIFNRQQWGNLGHLWTMSVEQQFYLMWPFVIMLTPRVALPAIIIVFITIGLWSPQLLPTTDYTGVLPQTCFDALGIGALVAWIVTFKPELLKKTYYTLTCLAVISVTLIFTRAILNTDILNFIHHRTCISLITIWFIVYFLHNKEIEGGKIGFIFNNRYLILIGKISYGFYLFHIPFLSYSNNMLHLFNRHLPFYRLIDESKAFYIIENFIAITMLAWVSWKYFELPINNLQKYFIRADRKAHLSLSRPLANTSSLPANGN